VGRLSVSIALVVLVIACQTSAKPVTTPLPSPTPHTPVTSTVLQAAEVPSGLTACQDSGPVATYLASLQVTAPALAQKVAQEWQALKKGGASEAAIALFASVPSACSAELGASGSIKSAASFVVAFGNEGQADRAWENGVLGFAPPAPGELPPGLARGTSTGLGPSSWSYDRSPIRLVCWRKSVFVAIVVFSNLDPGSFKAAAAAIDARLN
jgi:hypothetical protein